MRKWLLAALGAVLILLVGIFLALGFWPVRPDVPGVGSGGKAGDPSPPSGPDRRGTGQVLVVNEGESIQAAVDRAQPGDTVQVMPGLYRQEVLVQTESLTLEGVVDGDQRAVLDGEASRANAVLAVGDYFTITGLRMINYTSNGATVQGTTGAIFRDLITENTGEYGIFPILSTNVLVEHSVTSGVNDTGIYVGQSRDIVVRENEAFGNVSGIEIENSVNALVENNYAHDNTAGILVFILPGKTATEAADTRIVNNRIENNNLANFARPEMTVSLVPAGSGILILSADTTEVTGNTFAGNKSFAVALVALTDFPGFFGEQTAWDIPVVPENNWVHGNLYTNNGYNPDPEVIEAGFVGADLLWSTAGPGNRWDEPTATRFPSPLPGSSWPDFVQRAFWRALNYVAHL
jgi:parallel beta-helix repeat protein